MSHVGCGAARSLCHLLRSSIKTYSSCNSQLLHPIVSYARSVSIAPLSGPLRQHKPVLKSPRDAFGPLNQCATFHSTSCLPNKRKPHSSTSPVHKKNEKPGPVLGSLAEQDLEKAFGSTINAETGNAIIQILQDRRRTGSLVEFGVTLDEQYKDIPQSAAANALKWLRQNFPVDEQRAAAQYANRAEREARELGLIEDESTEPQNRDVSQTARTTHSVLDEYKRRNEEKRIAEEKERAESPEIQKSQELRLARREELASRRELAREKRQKSIQYWSERATGQDKLPDMSWWQRLLPGTAFASIMITCIAIAAELYMPPTEAERLIPEISPAAATIAGIIAINVVVWALWKIPPMWRYMNMYFLQVPGYPYALSLLGNTFSHMDMPHLWANMTGLMVYGYFLHQDIGRGNFVALYLSSAIFASCGSLWYYVLTRQWAYYSRGASGAIWGIMTAWAYFTASQPPKEGWWFYVDCGLYATLATQLLSQFVPGIMQRHDIPAHLFGALMGLAGSYYLRNQAERRRRQSAKTDEVLRKERSD